MKKCLVATVCCVLLGVGGSAWADLIYDFSGLGSGDPAGAVGSSQYSITHGGFTVTAFGLNANGTTHELYRKQGGGDENGLGLTSTLNNELTLQNDGTQIANYIKLDLSAVYHTSPFGKILMNSTTQDESYDMFGSNDANSLFAVNLTPNGSNAEGTYFDIPSWGQYKYITVAVHPGAPDNNSWKTSPHANDNVLLGALVVNPATIPEPGTATMIAAAMGLLMTVISRRKH